MKTNWIALTALVVLAVGCNNEEKPYTPPKGLAGNGATSSGDTVKPDSAASTGTAGKDEKALDLGKTSSAPSETSPIPDLPSNSTPNSAPPVEFPKGKDAPTPTPPPTPAPSPIIGPAKNSPEFVASVADKAMLALKDTQANIPILAMYGDMKGQIYSQLKLKDSKTYWAQYAHFEGGESHSVYEVSDGTKRTRMGVSAGSKKSAPASENEPLPDLDKMADAWLVDMPKLVLSPWVSGKPIFSDLVKSFKQAGYTAKCESVSMVRPEHTFMQDRITFELPASVKSTRGQSKTTIVFDHDHALPVSIEVIANPVKRAPVRVLWRAEWLFHKNFTAQTFTRIDGKSS